MEDTARRSIRPSVTRNTDPKARVSLPRAFANSTVIIEQVSDTELRIRKARIVPENEMQFREELTLSLSDRDRDRFLSLLNNPPPANELLRRAALQRSKRPGKNKRRDG